MQEQYALRYEVSGRSYVVGKIISVKGGRRVLYFALRPDKDILEKYDSLSVAPEVVAHLLAEGIEEIHAFDKTEKTLYVTSPDVVLEHGILASMHPSVGRRYHVPRRFWTRERLTYRVPYVKAERLIVAQDDNPSVQQLSLVLWEG